MSINNKCSRCGGSLLFENGRGHCLSCGFDKVNVRDRHQFIESNKDEILEDIKSLGSTKTRKKWGLSTSTIAKLSTPKSHVIRASVSTSHPPCHNVKLPELPPYSEQWDPSVQLKWLDIYQDLFRQGSEKQ